MLNQLITHLQLYRGTQPITVWVETQPALVRECPITDVWCVSEMRGKAWPTDMNPANWDTVSGILVRRGSKWYLPMLVEQRTSEYLEGKRKLKMADIEPYLRPNSGSIGFKTIDMHSIVKLELPGLHWEAEKWSSC